MTIFIYNLIFNINGLIESKINIVVDKAFQDYADDSKKFKAKLKKAGITSTNDLKKSFADKGLEDLIH